MLFLNRIIWLGILLALCSRASATEPEIRLVLKDHRFSPSEVAAPVGQKVRLVIENHGDLRIAEIERILDEVNSPWLGVQFDLLEQVAIFEDPGQAAERLLPHAFTVHWNDAYSKLSNSGFCVEPCPPGRGIIDLDGVFNKIASLSQDVYIFAAFQAASDASEDELVKAYLDDLHNRLHQIRLNQ